MSKLKVFEMKWCWWWWELWWPSQLSANRISYNVVTTPFYTGYHTKLHISYISYNVVTTPFYTGYHTKLHISYISYNVVTTPFYSRYHTLLHWIPHQSTWDQHQPTQYLLCISPRPISATPCWITVKCPKSAPLNHIWHKCITIHHDVKSSL